MIRPLCLLGIHRAVWEPVTLPDGGGWLQVRKCRDCGRPLGRTHRE